MDNVSDNLPKKSKYNIYILGVLVFLVSFLVFLPSINNGFVWDDVINIQNEYYKFKNSNFKSILIPKKIDNKKNSYYRPIIHFSIVYDYKTWGNNPLGHPLSNSYFYSISSLLFLILVLSCKG